MTDFLSHLARDRDVAEIQRLLDLTRGTKLLMASPLDGLPAR